MQVPHLESARLILRPYHPDDFDAFVALNGDTEVRRHVSGPLTRADAATRFQSFIGDGTFNGEAWAVTLRGTGAYIGHCWLAIAQEAGDPELGFLITASQWRQGYGTEIAVATLDYAITSRRDSRVIATVDADHPASIRVLERAGMRREREQRDEDGVYFVYSVMRPKIR